MAHQHPHHHDEDDHAIQVIEEPLDPASQSLSDAMRASFRVLKIVMVVVVILFLFSGVIMVDEKEVVVLSRFGKLVNENRPLDPGLHLAFPYPIDDVVRVFTADQTIEVDAFWLKLTDAEKLKDLSDLSSRSGGLDPATHGALLTGDRAIMHLRFTAQYRIEGPIKFVKNVSDKDALLQTVLMRAAIAEAARTTANVIWRQPTVLADAIRSRGQKALDEADCGITLKNVVADESHYPLQTSGAFIAVSTAVQRRHELIRGALTEREKTLKGAAGSAWEEIHNEIDKLDALEDGPRRDAVMGSIRQRLVSEATGKAGERIRQAEGRRDRIVADARGREVKFKALLAEYRLSPELVRERELQIMLKDLFGRIGVSKWIVPQGQKVIYLSMDPQETREREREMMKLKTAARR